MKKLFMLLMLALFSVTSVNAQCPTDLTACQTTRLNISTGINTGGPLAVGANDPRWNITAVPAGSGIPVPSPAIVIGVNSGWNNSAFGGVMWLGPAANSHTVTPPTGSGSYTLTRTFCVCVAGSFNVSGNMNSDDAAQLMVDGTIILPMTGPTGWGSVDPFGANVTLGVGLHTVSITVQNTTGGPTGAVLNGNITSNGTGRLCCETGIGISGIKYNDVNNNGVIDGGDTPLSGWTFTLTGGGTTYTAVTNAAGQYNFTGLYPANYTLSETIKPGWMAVTPAGGTTTVNYTAGDNLTRHFLNKIIPEARGCCDDINTPNLVINGSFEGGNMNFTTGSYIFQPTAGPNSVHEGRYSVLTGTDAGLVSNCWDIPDHTTCSADGRFLVVNGRTHGSSFSTVYQQGNIQVTPGEEYIFCMYYRHLPQCAFDIFDSTKLSVFVAGAAEISEADCEEENNCGWTKISFSFIPTFPITSLSVFLDEAGVGDGNDLAFDDFSLRKKIPTPAQYCDFNIQSSGSGSPKTITATAVTNPLPAGFDIQWTVSEVNCSTWADIGTPMSNPAWNSYVTNFPGFGGFDVLKCYRITRRVISCCYTPCEYTWYVSAQPQPMVLDNGGNPTTEPGKDDLYMSLDHINWMRIDGVASVASDDIRLFPNPGDGNVTIQSSHSLENTTLTIYSSDSKVISKQRIDGRKGSVNINNLPSGVYSFELVEPDGTRTYKKYVKQ